MTDNKAGMGTIITVQADPTILASLRRRLAAGLRSSVESVSTPEEAFARLEEQGAGVEALVLGPQVEAPIQVAQRAYALDRALAVMIVADPEHFPQLSRALLYTPFIGENVICRSAVQGQEIALALQDAIEVVRQRRRYRATVAAVDVRVPTVNPLQPQAEYLERLLHYAPIGVVALDARGLILAWNRKAGQILGGLEGQVVGTPLARLFPDPDREKVRSLVTHSASSGGEPPSEILERAAGSGRTQFVEVTVAPLPDPAAGSGSLVLLQDVTDRIAAQREREQAEQERAESLARERAARIEAQEAVQARNAVLSSVSHDLRNPLTTVKGLAQSLRRRVERLGLAGAEQIVQGLTQIDTTATKMAAQISELLDVARLQAGRPLDLDRRPTDLVALARRAVEEQQKTTDRHTIRLEPIEPDLVGDWDPDRLDRVLSNLLSNAIKYSPGGGLITVVVRRHAGPTGDGAALEVQDDGVGIPAADLPHVFERFHRASNVGRIEGTGIGLASVRQVVEQHGGTVSAVSRAGTGSTFTVWLPLAPGGDNGSEGLT